VHLDGADHLEEENPALARMAVDIVSMRAGDAVFHDCLTVHGAFANSSTMDRLAFSIQFMPSTARYNGWLHDFLRPFAPQVGQELNFSCFARPRL
jgi:ectoine hydroxylase-related dioxygenase (phytanoyl-CoA dioxygenase family)